MFVRQQQSTFYLRHSWTICSQFRAMIRVLPIIFGTSIVSHHAATIENKRLPKFEFYVYNDFGNLVKQYLTSEQIQELLRGHGHPAGEEQIKYLLGKESEEIQTQSVNLKTESTEAQLPLAVPTVTHDDSPNLRRVMSKVWKVIRKAESDRTSTTTPTTTTTTTATTTSTPSTPVMLVEMDDKLTRHNILNLIEEEDLLCLKFAKKCIKLGKQEVP